MLSATMATTTIDYFHDLLLTTLLIIMTRIVLKQNMLLLFTRTVRAINPV